MDCVIKCLLHVRLHDEVHTMGLHKHKQALSRLTARKNQALKGEEEEFGAICVKEDNMESPYIRVSLG